MSLKRTSYYLLLGFLPLASNFLLAPLFTRYLSAAEYGIIALATLFQQYAMLIVDPGLKGAFSRYYYRYFRYPKLVDALFSTTVVGIVAALALTLLVFNFFGDRIFLIVFKNNDFTFERYGNLVLLLTFNTVVNAVILTYYRNSERVKDYALVSLSTFFLMAIGSVIAVVALKGGAWGNIVGKLLGSAIVVYLFLAVWLFRKGLKFDLRLVKKLLVYGLPLIPYGILNTTILNLDRFFIERYFDLSVLGQYNIAFLISTIPSILLNAYQSAVNPGIIKLMETTNKNNTEANNREVNRNFQYLVMLMCSVLWVLITFSGPFVRFYVGPEYRVIIGYLPILIIGFMPLVYQNIFSLPLFFHYQSRLLPLLSLATLAGSVVFNFLLINWLGIYGAAIAVLLKNMLFAYSTMFALRARRLYTPAYFAMGKYNWLMMLVVLTGVAVVALVYYFPEHYTWTTVATGLATGTIAVIIFGSELRTIVTVVKSRIHSKM